MDPFTFGNTTSKVIFAARDSDVFSVHVWLTPLWFTESNAARMHSEKMHLCVFYFQCGYLFTYDICGVIKSVFILI